MDGGGTGVDGRQERVGYGGGRCDALSVPGPRAPRRAQWPHPPVDRRTHVPYVVEGHSR
ncbi:hypothetical protein SCATT_57270 [Streptantibioticus cattleyicolor NRRL 8057 = DSM 46488]|uniref:Uncharacterized protein n=1 Tax=Streptantibioticus cattleyicolor (strain ATCC 35852 / DSM 46488 / JCM 4925 / NBRC 14057 / NRRL 8057) TaxID=1003195 RepID=G8WYG7_STREN|nr:hypothetical protein SCATT_57270 [Streptantibioticus cattleyicolor NRRL 8057 = DSM 46488]